MKSFCLVALLVCVVASQAFQLPSKASPSRVTLRPFFDQHGRQSPKWSVIGEPSSSDMVSFRVLLKQQNLDELERVFWAVSTPSSPQYMKYLTKAQIDDIVRSRPSTVKTVQDWISTFTGVKSAKVNVDFIQVEATVEATEAMFQSKLQLIKRVELKKPMLKFITEYSVPKEIAAEIDFVAGITELFDITSNRQFGADPNEPRAPSASQTVAVPMTTRNMYNVASNRVATGISTGVSEYYQDAYNPSDLAPFFREAGVKYHNPVRHVGPFTPQSPDYESTLDIEWIMAMGLNSTAYYYTINAWVLEFAQDLNSEQHPPLLNSISWGAADTSDGASYNRRCDQEWKKLGGKGVTVLASSGDAGASGIRPHQCEGNQHYFNPSYPASSPYVVGVGATMMDAGFVDTRGQFPSVCQTSGYQCASNCSFESPANVPSITFASGGGFAWYDTAPAYQKSQLDNYMNDQRIPKPPSHLFNPKNRGYPDISALGWQVLILHQGQWMPIGGTSASSPMIAGMFALINNHLASNGKQPLGFVNPTLYEMIQKRPSTFTSIGGLDTNNNNQCQYGYTSNPSPSPNSWDPVTGLGVPNIEEMINYFDSQMEKLPNRA